MENYQLIYPTPALKPFVRHYWTLKMDGLKEFSQTIVPIGNAQLIFHKKDLMYSSKYNHRQPDSFICGLSNSFEKLSVSGNIEMIVVVLQPLGIKVFFDTPADKFYNSTISLKDVGDENLKELEKRIYEEDDISKCIGLIENYLFGKLNNFDSQKYNRILPAIQAINQCDHVKLPYLSGLSCLSQRQFYRLFSELVGTNPKDFMRIVRFQRALYTLQKQPHISLTELTYNCGYYDQPHLIKEFREFSGYTPTQYLSFGEIYSDYFSL